MAKENINSLVNTSIETSQAEKQRKNNYNNKQNVKEVWVSKELHINWNMGKEQRANLKYIWSNNKWEIFKINDRHQTKGPCSS